MRGAREMFEPASLCGSAPATCCPSKRSFISTSGAAELMAGEAVWMAPLREDDDDKAADAEATALREDEDDEPAGADVAALRGAV